MISEAGVANKSECGTSSGRGRAREGGSMMARGLHVRSFSLAKKKKCALNQRRSKGRAVRSQCTFGG